MARATKTAKAAAAEQSGPGTEQGAEEADAGGADDQQAGGLGGLAAEAAARLGSGLDREPSKEEVAGEDQLNEEEQAELNVIDAGAEEEERLERLRELLRKDPDQTERKADDWMTVDEMKEERRLRGDKNKVLFDPKGHSNRVTHRNNVIKLRKQQRQAKEADALDAVVDPGQWEDGEDEIVKQADVTATDGSKPRWTRHDYFRLVLAKLHSDSATALGILARGHADEKTKRLELDGNKQDRDPWVMIKQVYSNPKTAFAHIAPDDDRMGELDWNKAFLDWPQEVLQRKDGVLRTDASMIFVDYEASGNYDLESLPNFLHPTARRTLTIKDRTLLHVSALSVPPLLDAVHRPSA
jgi:hypothetical protein